MGGQGVLAIPNVYEGWTQQTAEECQSKGKFKAELCGNEMARYLKDLKKSQLDPLSVVDDKKSDKDDD